MYLVNTSFTVDHTVHACWLELMAGRYLPFLREKGFAEFVFTRVISVEASDHFTYSLQVPVPDLEQYRRLTGEVFGEYEQIAGPLFGDRVLWFTSLMKRVELP